MSDDTGPIEHQELPQRRLPLGELLVMAGVLDRATLKQALAAQRGRRIRLGALLVEMGALTEQQITQAVAGQLGLHIVDLAQFKPREEALRAVPYTMAKENGVLPLIVDDANDGGARLLYAAFSDPTNLRATNTIQIHTGFRVRPVMIEESALVAAIDDYYDLLRQMGAPVEGAGFIPTLAPVEPTPAAPPMALDASYLTPVEVAPAEPMQVDAQPMALDASHLTPVEVAPVGVASVDAQPMALDASYLTPIEGAPVDAQPMALDASFLTPVEAAPVAPAIAAPTSWDAWPEGAAPASPDEARAIALDNGDDALELDLSRRPASADAPMAVDAREIALPEPPAPSHASTDPFDVAIPLAHAMPDDEPLEELDEVDDADVSPIEDDDPFDRSFQGFDATTAAPAVSVDPFFSDPLPSEIVTLAPNQLRALISAAMERGSLDPADVAAVAQNDDG